MAHFNIELPAIIAAGIERESDQAKEEIDLVGGGTFRNQLWETPLRSYTVPFAPRDLGELTVKAVLEVEKVTEYGIHTFNYFDELDNEFVPVRFANKLVATHVAGSLWRIEPVTLVEEPA